MSNPLYSERFWLLLVYPLSAVVVGVGTWWFIAWRMPQEPHPGLYGASTAVVSAAVWYLQSWRLRRRRREAAGTDHPQGL